MQPTMSSPALRTDEPKVHPQLARTLDLVMDVCLHGAVLFIPLLFWSASIDALELPKQTLLIFLGSIALMAWIGKAVALKSFSVQRGWIHLVTVVAVLGFGILSLFSADRYLSYVGVLGQMPWAFSTLASLLALYLVAVNRVRSIGQVYDLLLSFLLSSLLIALHGLFQLMGWYILPGAITKTSTFSLVGSVFSLAVYLVTPLMIASGLAFHGCRNNACALGSEKPVGVAARVLVWLTIIVPMLVLVMVDYWVAWAALLFCTVVMVLVGLKRGLSIGHPAKYGIPLVISIAAALLLFLPTPIKVELPAEVAPSATASWNIAKQALRDMPLIGSGPGTWMYDYAKYRDPMVNASPFWNVRFDRGFSLFLTLVATTGIVGTAMWVLWLVLVLVKSGSHLMNERNDDAWYAYVAAFIGWATFTFATFFYNFNVSHLLAWFLLLALLGSMTSGSAWVWDTKRSRYTFEILATLLVLVVVGTVSAMWLSGQRLVADLAFTSGVQAFRSGRPVDEVIASLERARRLNPMVDMYARNLSQAYLIKAAQLIQKQPTQEEGVIIQAAIKSAVDIGISASTTNPVNVDNFSNLAVVYQSIASFTRGADEFAIAAYNEALRREPSNPVFIGEVGKLYLLRADAYRTQLNNTDSVVREDAKANVEANLKTAEEVLKRARSAKPDYLPARYYLGIVYERQTQLKEAITELANVFQLNQQDIGVAFELSILLYRDGQKDLALNVMEEVVRRDGANVNAKWYLAAMYEERGNIDNALALVNDLANRFPDNQAVQQRLRILQEAKLGGAMLTGLPEPVPEPIENSTDNNPVR